MHHKARGYLPQIETLAPEEFQIRVVSGELRHWETRRNVVLGLNVVPALNSEFLHLGIQGRSLQAKSVGRAAFTADHTLAFAQDAENVIAFGGLKVRIHRTAGLGRSLEFREWWAQHGPRGKNHRPLYEILEFANVTRPAPVHKGLHGFRRNRFNPLSHALRMAAQKIPDEQRNVFATLAQRRKGDRKNLQAIVQVAAKLSGDHLGEIAIGGGDQADIDGNGSCPADAFKFFFLQRTQNLRLEFRRQVTDFIEEERALVGELKSADLLRDGPGERPFSRGRRVRFPEDRTEWRSN